MSYQGTSSFSKQAFQTLSIKMQISNRISLNSPMQYFSIQPRSVDQVLKIYSQKRNSFKKKAQQSSYQSSTADSRQPTQISKKFQSIVLNQGVQSVELNDEIKKTAEGVYKDSLYKNSFNKVPYQYKPNRYQLEGTRRPRSSTNNKLYLLNASSETKDSGIKDCQMQFIRSVPSVQQSDDIETIKQEELQQNIGDLRSSQVQTQKLKIGSYTLTPDRLKRIRSKQNHKASSLNTSLIDNLVKDSFMESRMKMIRSQMANYKPKCLYQTQEIIKNSQPQKDQLKSIKERVGKILKIFKLREQSYIKKIKSLTQENDFLKQELIKKN